MNPEWQARGISNLGDLATGVEFVESVLDIQNPPQSYDFVITDGGRDEDDDLWDHVCRVSKKGVIYVEGCRLAQQDKIRRKVGNRAFVAGNFRSLNRRFGYWIYRFEPTWLERLRFGRLNCTNRIYSGIKTRVRLARG